MSPRQQQREQALEATVSVAFQGWDSGSKVQMMLF
jgi:hypothetical protein